MGDERRESPRHEATLPAQIETDAGRFTAALTKDVSESGLLVMSHQTLDVGTGVTIHLRFGGAQYVVTGKVVRQESMTTEEAAMWRSRSAVAVDTTDSDLGMIFAALTATK